MTHQLYEAEIVEGLEDIAHQELQQRFKHRIQFLVQDKKASMRFRVIRNNQLLNQLRSVIAIYEVHHFDIPRPKALLGHQHFTRLTLLIQKIQCRFPSDSFQSLTISAAGSQSTVMQRLKDELAQATQLIRDDNKGDLWIRLKRPPKKQTGWEVLIRTTPRPLATRDWRIQNMEGALNATVAHAMIRISEPAHDDSCINIGCGSGTLLIEHQLYQSPKWLVGIDIDHKSINYTQINLKEIGNHAIELIYGDATEAPFPNQTFDKLYADLPFGQSIGSHDENQHLYPSILQEAWRVAKSNAVFMVITHEIRLMNTILKSSKLWKIEQERMITLRGLHPRIYKLRKQS